MITVIFVVFQIAVAHLLLLRAPASYLLFNPIFCFFFGQSRTYFFCNSLLQSDQWCRISSKSLLVLPIKFAPFYFIFLGNIFF